MGDEEIKREGGKKLQKSYFDVMGLCSSSEVGLIENVLKALDGVQQISVIFPSRTLVVLHDPLLISHIQIVKALNQIRVEANVRAYGDSSYRQKWPSPYAVCSGFLLALSFLKFVFHPFQWLALAAVAVGIFPIAFKGFAAIRNFRIDINILVLIAVIGTIIMNDYLEAGTIVFLFTIAEWLESRASHKAMAAMSSLMSIAPQKAVIAETGEVVDVDGVKLSTVLAVKAGEIIPIDGIVTEGRCEVDEKTLTGESFPVVKQKDSTVWAGTMNLNGYISIKTTAVAKECVVGRMIKLVEEAQNNKSKAQRFIDSCAKFYTPAVVVISTGLALIPVALKLHNLCQWFHIALVVLVSACPCALILSTPVATFCALSKAATSGLLIKGGDYLEILAKIKIVAFDKTGTITRGEFVVTDFRSISNNLSLNTLLYWSVSIEPKPENVDDFLNFPGEGIYGEIDGKDIYIGNRKIALRAGCGTVPALESDTKEGKTIGYIYSGATPVGIFSLSDACRPGVADAIKILKLMGMKTAMLTGDNHAAATHAQDQIEHVIEAVHAELLPEDKVRIIEEFKKDGPTAMIGDGLNDAPALAAADIGISMGISGSALATDTGDIVLMSNDIRKISKAIQLAQKTRSKIIQNVTLSLTAKASILALALAGHPLIWAAVLADVGTCLLVIFNSMLLLQGTHQDRGKCCKSSTSPYLHKHGFQTGSHQSHDVHCCCYESRPLKVCEPLKCSSHTCGSFSSRTCRNRKCADPTERKYGSVGSDRLCEAKDCNHGSCNMVTHEKKLHNFQYHSCPDRFVVGSCGKDKCVVSNEGHDSCMGGHGLQEAEHGHHRSCNNVIHDTESCSIPDERQQTTDTSHCHVKDEGLGCMVDCRNEHQQEPDGKHLHSIIDIVMGIDHAKLVARHVCMSLDKRETAGCCKSYKKECCGEHGHFGAGFGGGLSEIITE